MNELVKYDLYRRRNGLLYRVSLHGALYGPAEFYATGCWVQSHLTIFGVITGSASTLVARNVVFKD
ncbi:hypothetical protein HOS83_gp06 [Shigella phage SFN6B]|uniref:Uncharacterized protein n=1 Tax=Shigella phage SFN6B TaxID=1785176 RepID=A0A2P0XMX6_9CAUD|nr:hypothetical protein HOS83_gp06 [Shigella phage SFN6B]AVD98961.1 hypothetical protein [Shigella phage SFN6B]